MFELKVGVRAKMGKVVGTIIEQNGGLFRLKTPHGTVLEAGMIWVKPLTDEDELKLQMYEKMAIEDRNLNEWSCNL